jgi:hypothetical protein
VSALRSFIAMSDAKTPLESEEQEAHRSRLRLQRSEQRLYSETGELGAPQGNSPRDKVFTNVLELEAMASNPSSRGLPMGLRSKTNSELVASLDHGRLATRYGMCALKSMCPGSGHVVSLG